MSLCTTLSVWAYLHVRTYVSSNQECLETFSLCCMLSIHACHDLAMAQTLQLAKEALKCRTIEGSECQTRSHTTPLFLLCLIFRCRLAHLRHSLILEGSQEVLAQPDENLPLFASFLKLFSFWSNQRACPACTFDLECHHFLGGKKNIMQTHQVLPQLSHMLCDHYIRLLTHVHDQGKAPLHHILTFLDSEDQLLFHLLRHIFATRPTLTKPSSSCCFVGLFERSGGRSKKEV